MSYNKEIKAIKLLQDRSNEIEKRHNSISNDIDEIKLALDILDSDDLDDDDIDALNRLDEQKTHHREVKDSTASKILEHADRTYGKLGITDILTAQDLAETEDRISQYVLDFNKRYSLDNWDYAIAGSCGLFAALLDWLCVKAPLKPTTAFETEVDGIFNKAVQTAFNKILPPELSHKLSVENTIGAPDASTVRMLVDPPDKALNPYNHRLRALSHDPVLGLFFGVRDMINGTCTAVIDGKIVTLKGKAGPTDGSIIDLIVRMFKHLLSDVNAPSAAGNRGMGLPAPFMGLLRMFTFPVGDSTFDKQIEWMFVNGYDFRQFVAVSIPCVIMEVLMRCFYVAKQMHEYDASFGESLLDTIPFKLNPRFRIMLTIAYGTLTAINAGKLTFIKIY